MGELVVLPLQPAAAEGLQGNLSLTGDAVVFSFPGIAEETAAALPLAVGTDYAGRGHAAGTAGTHTKTDPDRPMGKLLLGPWQRVEDRQQDNCEEDNSLAIRLALGGVAVKSADVILADSMPTEAKTLQRYSKLLAEVRSHKEAAHGSSKLETKRKSSLDILRSAANHDPGSRQALLTDARTHVYEVFGGVGESMSVELDVNSSNEVVWGSSTSTDRQFHVLTSYEPLPVKISELLHSEGKSNMRLEDLYAEGLLEGKAVFDFSAMAETSREELSDWGFFLNSIACSIRRTNFQDDKCRVDSIFLAGVDQREVKPVLGESQQQEADRQEIALSKRFDIKVLRKMYQFFGYEDADKMSPAEMLVKPVITPDSYDIVDMSMLYDFFAAEELPEGTQAFMGSVELWQQIGSPETLTREHYESHMSQREQRQHKYDELCEEIVDEQIRRNSEATTPLEAVNLKRRVVLDKTVEKASEDTSIDVMRFGRVAAPKVERARWALAQGDVDGAINLLKEAKKEAIDPSCPASDAKKTRELLQGKAATEAECDDECKEVKDGDEVTCPYCGEQVKAKVPKKGGRIYCSNSDCDEYFGKK